jgi:hypothetical protein
MKAAANLLFRDAYQSLQSWGSYALPSVVKLWVGHATIC